MIDRERLLRFLRDQTRLIIESDAGALRTAQVGRIIGVAPRHISIHSVDRAVVLTIASLVRVEPFPIKLEPGELSVVPDWARGHVAVERSDEAR